jgi:hypothetical protein
VMIRYVPGTLPGLISHLQGQWSPVSGIREVTAISSTQS